MSNPLKELDLRLGRNGQTSHVQVDGQDLTNITYAKVETEVRGTTTVEVRYLQLGRPFTLRGLMEVVYDGPSEEVPDGNRR